MKTFARLFALLFIATIPLACKGDSESELDKALAAVTGEQLALMVLPQDAYGDGAEGLDTDTDSGVTEAGDVADDSFDPDDKASDIENAGFEDGYELTFIDSSFAALEEGGVFSASSSVDLYDNADSASAQLQKDLADGQEFEGSEIEPGVKLEEIEQFEVDGIADDAVGLNFRATFNEAEFWGTGVLFTVGPIRASVGFNRGDDKDIKGNAEEVGQALADRIEAVLLGDVDDTPVPIPEEDQEEGEASADAPAEPPFPDEMALDTDDLPDGATVETESYVADEDTESSYEREFDVEGVPFAGSELAGLENDIDLYENDGEAGAIFIAVKAIFTGEDAAEFFAQFFQEGADFEATNMLVSEVSAPTVGDESFVVRATYDTPAGPFENLFLYVRSGRANGILIVTALGGAVQIEDLIPLQASLAEKMASELADNP